MRNTIVNLYPDVINDFFGTESVENFSWDESLDVVERELSSGGLTFWPSKLPASSLVFPYVVLHKIGLHN